MVSCTVVVVTNHRDGTAVVARVLGIVWFSRGRADWHMSFVNTRLPGKLDGYIGHLPTGSHSAGLSWFM